MNASGMKSDELSNNLMAATDDSLIDQQLRATGQNCTAPTGWIAIDFPVRCCYVHSRLAVR
jgi:hypothetical protein